MCENAAIRSASPFTEDDEGSARTRFATGVRASTCAVQLQVCRPGKKLPGWPTRTILPLKPGTSSTCARASSQLPAGLPGIPGPVRWTTCGPCTKQQRAECRYHGLQAGLYQEYQLSAPRTQRPVLTSRRPGVPLHGRKQRPRAVPRVPIR